MALAWGTWWWCPQLLVSATPIQCISRAHQLPLQDIPASDCRHEWHQRPLPAPSCFRPPSLLPGGCSSLLLRLQTSTLSPTDRSVQTDSVVFSCSESCNGSQGARSKSQSPSRGPQGPTWTALPSPLGLIPHPSSPSSSAPASLATLLSPGTGCVPTSQPSHALAPLP